MALNDTAARAAAGARDAVGYNFGGELYNNADEQARQKIAELEQRIAALEAQPATRTYHDYAAWQAALAKGETKDNDIIIFENDPTDEELAAGTETESGTGDAS